MSRKKIPLIAGRFYLTDSDFILRCERVGRDKPGILGEEPGTYEVEPVFYGILRVLVGPDETLVGKQFRFTAEGQCRRDKQIGKIIAIHEGKQ